MMPMSTKMATQISPATASLFLQYRCQASDTCERRRGAWTAPAVIVVTSTAQPPSSLLKLDPRVEHAVETIDQQIDDHDQQAEDEDRRHAQRDVVLRKRIRQQRPEPWDGENVLDPDGSDHREGEGRPNDGDQGGQRGAHGIPDDKRPVAHPL